MTSTGASVPTLVPASLVGVKPLTDGLGVVANVRQTATARSRGVFRHITAHGYRWMDFHVAFRRTPEGPSDITIRALPCALSRRMIFVGDGSEVEYLGDVDEPTTS
mmetsp:Transcript_8800/g.22775  ORF Transcript_8800/g.22775 Transcript_8800/m.22775 type:complete len:106 (+) Transcript_8800:509-826(+)